MQEETRRLWEALTRKATISYRENQSKKWLSATTTRLLKEAIHEDNPNRDYMKNLVSLPEEERFTQQVLQEQAHGARENYDLPDAPSYLPYNPITGVFSTPYTTSQNQVKDMRVFLMASPYNWPQSIGNNVDDRQNCAQVPLSTVFKYKHTDTPPAMLKRIHICGSYSQIKYDPTKTVNEAVGFFSDNAGVAASAFWRIEYLGASKLLYTNPAYPNTYPNNELLRWNNTAILTAQSTHFYRSAAANQWQTDQSLNPVEENIFNWVIDLPKGVHIGTNDAIQLVTGYPTRVNGVDQFDKLYVACDLEIIDFDFNYLEITRTTSILVTLAATEEPPENPTENATRILMKK